MSTIKRSEALNYPRGRFLTNAATIIGAAQLAIIDAGGMQPAAAAAASKPKPQTTFAALKQISASSKSDTPRPARLTVLQ